MAVSTVGSLSEIFTAGVPLQTEDAAPAVGGNQDKPPRSPSNLDPIVEDAEDADESVEKDAGMKDVDEGIKGAVEENGSSIDAEGDGGKHTALQ